MKVPQKRSKHWLEDGVHPDQIIAGWAEEIETFDTLAGTYRLYAEDSGGQPDPGEGDAVEATADLAAALADYVDAGAVAGPLAHQLTNAVELAQRHLEAGRVVPGMRALERFIRHLDNPKRSDTLTEEAEEDLRNQATAVLRLLE